MGPSFLSMLVFAVRVIGFLYQRCVYFSGLYLADRTVLYLSFSLLWSGCLYRLEVFRNGVTLYPVQRSSCLLLLACAVSTVSKSHLLLHISTPLPVHRMRLHSYPNRGLIAEGFRLSTIRMGCFFIQS